MYVKNLLPHSKNKTSPPERAIIFPTINPIDFPQINGKIIPIQVVGNKGEIHIEFGNNPMVGMTVSTAVSIEEAAKAGKF